MDRLGYIGQLPPLTRIENPAAQENYRPVNMPLPAPEVATYKPNSLWRSGARTFFKDQRAARVGDILTIKVDMADSAKFKNKSTRSRVNSEEATGEAFWGHISKLPEIFPDAVADEGLVNLDSETSNEGQGEIDRSETIKMDVAAVITQVLGNGNFVIMGTQEMRVNFEIRELSITGIIRQEDIQSDNTIPYRKIAEARISYGGRGQISDYQQPRVGSQFYDIIAPF